jgi:ubiquinone/menaquinone biosynthesis C-methylase UbiE
MTPSKTHWKNIYSVKALNEVSWYREHLDNSLKLILQTDVKKDGEIIDVGGGSSTLVDDLLDNGFSDLSVLDISAKAIEKSRERLGTDAAKVKWIEAD